MERSLEVQARGPVGLQRSSSSFRRGAVLLRGKQKKKKKAIVSDVFSQKRYDSRGIIKREAHITEYLVHFTGRETGRGCIRVMPLFTIESDSFRGGENTHLHLDQTTSVIDRSSFP